MIDSIRMKHGLVTFAVSVVLLGGIGWLIYIEHRRVGEMARAALLADPEYGTSPAAALVEESLAAQDRQVLASTIGLLLLFAIWMGLSTAITTREVASQLRKLSAAIKEIGGHGRGVTVRIEDEVDVSKLLSALHAQASSLREASQWAPSASMVLRVEDAARPRVQPGFYWRWAFLTSAVFFVAQMGSILVWQLQSWRDVGIAVGAWFVGGFLIAVLSPGRTILEPAVGALFAAQATIFYLLLGLNPDLEGSMLSEYVLGAVLGFVLALAGASAGEWIQTRLSRAGRKPKPKKK